MAKLAQFPSKPDRSEWASRKLDNAIRHLANRTPFFGGDPGDDEAIYVMQAAAIDIMLDGNPQARQTLARLAIELGEVS